jgi:ATP-dependent HslUV protease ATP-binding subunit HslU
LHKDEFIQILTEPQNALLKQYEALMGTEGVKVKFTEDAIEQIAAMAEKVNNMNENIGARRLHTIMEKVMEDISFDAPETGRKEIVIDKQFVQEHLRDIIEDQDLSRFIL